MLRSYIHGVDETLATQVLQPGDERYLLAMLREADFPRPDNLVAFLASDQSEYISGQAISVDGGLSIS